MNKKLKKQTTDFLKCGLIGWGMECLWTGCGSLCGEKNKKIISLDELEKEIDASPDNNYDEYAYPFGAWLDDKNHK